MRFLAIVLLLLPLGAACANEGSNSGGTPKYLSSGDDVGSFGRQQALDVWNGLTFEQRRGACDLFAVEGYSGTVSYLVDAGYPSNDARASVSVLQEKC
jgi:hypothetical protein